MARIRTIKPELWSDAAFVECSSNARLLFVAGLNFASDYGVLIDNPTQLKISCFPGDDVPIATLVDELVDARLWIRSTAPDGTNVLVVRTFTEHQRVDKPSGGRFGDPANWPEFVERSENGPRTIAERSTSIRAEGSKEGRNMRIADAHDDSFDAFWSQYPRKVDKKKARTAWCNMTTRDKASACEAISVHAQVWATEKRPTEKMPHPTTWLHGRRWEDELATSSQQNSVMVDGVRIARSAM